MCHEDCHQPLLYDARHCSATLSDLQSASYTHAKVAKLADAPDLGSGGAIRGGSSPPFRTISIELHSTTRDLEITR
jgi:hypothetical protein